MTNMQEMDAKPEERDELAKTRRARENQERADADAIRLWETKAALANWEANNR